MKTKALLAEWEDLLQSTTFVDYCPNGLQCEGTSEVHKIAFAVSASLATIREAVHQKVDMLVVHHGLFWDKDPYPVVGARKEKLSLLLEAGISLVAYHLPLDAHQQIGNNWKAARELGWEQLDPFFLQGKHHLGVHGRFASQPVDLFQKQLERYYGRSAHVALGGPDRVSSAALVSGGAHKLIQQAADLGVDCFITGSFDEMIWDIAHERKIHFFALGHYSTERVGPRALMAHCQHAHPEIVCSWIEKFNPF